MVFISGSIKSDDAIPDCLKSSTSDLIFSKLETTSRPPSVVTSIRFSGTIVTIKGFAFLATEITSSESAISRLSLIEMRSLI